MAEKKKGNIASRITELVKDTVEECGCMLWDVEFVKEGQDHNLFIYIDKPEGISLTDCEMIHKKIIKTIDFLKRLWYNNHIKNKHGKERLTKPLLVFVINAYFGGT